ncbi:MAG TPA: molybdopterin cofactor-binding domain-containing protein, partial [Thermoanaerobaculia bacterium]
LADGKTVKAGDLTLERPRLTRVLQTLRAKSNWGKKLGSGRGQGVACNIYDGDTHLGYAVEVTADEKRWRVDRVVCAVDCGVAVNPTGVEQQIESGVIWALGQLMSQITIRSGRVEQSSYSDYNVPHIADAPRIEVHILSSDKEQAFGMGEPPVPPLVPAVLNAIFDATGKRIRRLPVA